MSQKKKGASTKGIECKDFQDTLQKENSILKEMLNETENMHLVYLDNVFNFVRVNEAYAKTCGYKPEEMIGKNHFRLYPSEEIEAIFKRVRDTGVPAKFIDKPFVFPDQLGRGVTYWDWTLKPVKNEAGEVEGLIFSLVETTERKKAEKEIQNLAKFPSENPNPVMRINKDGFFLYCNGAAKQILNGLKCKEGEAITERWRTLVDESFDTGKRQEFEEQIGERTFVFALSPLTDYVNVYGYDITERKKAEALIELLNDRFKIAQNAAQIGIWDWNVKTGKIEWTPQMFVLLGLNPRKTIVSFDSWNAVLHPEDREKANAKITEALNNHSFLNNEYRIVRPDGQIVWINALGQGEYDEQKQPVRMTGICMDITKRKKVEEALLKSEKRYRRLYETSQDGIMARDLRGRMINCNRAYTRMLGYSKGELRTLSVRRLLPKKWRGQRDKIYRLIIETGVSRVFVREYVRKDGSVFQASVRSWPLTDDSGKVVGVWSVVRDISDLKKTEDALRKAEWVSRHRAEELEVIKTKLEKKTAEVEEYATHMEKLAQERLMKLKDAERLAAIGATAGMVGHDIRNPLQSISGDTYLALKELIDLPPSEQKQNIKESLENIDGSVEYINKIVQDLQDFARPICPVVREVDLEALCEEMLFKNGVPDNVEASCRVEEGAKKLATDQDLLKRILSNLVTNAVQAMPDGGKLTVQAYKKADDIVITVEDCGTGIPQEVRPLLFRPLVTTKSKGQGFGLAVVKRMTEALGGAVTFESKTGKGTKFVVRFPTAEK